MRRTRDEREKEATRAESDRDVDDYYRVNERAVIGCGKLATRVTSYRSFATRSPWFQPWPLIVALNITEPRRVRRRTCTTYTSMYRGVIVGKYAGLATPRAGQGRVSAGVY